MAPGTNEDLMLRPQVKAHTHPPHRPLPLLILYLNQTFYTQGPSMSGELVGTSFLCSFRELNMKETNPPLPTSSVPPQRGGRVVSRGLTLQQARPGSTHEIRQATGRRQPRAPHYLTRRSHYSFFLTKERKTTSTISDAA